jgi:hypothetical protein
VGYHTAAYPAFDRDQAFGFEDAQRLPQRRAGHAEPLDEVRLPAERLPVGQLTTDDERPELVSDTLGHLPRRAPAVRTGHLIVLPISGDGVAPTPSEHKLV